MEPGGRGAYQGMKFQGRCAKHGSRGLESLQETEEFARADAVTRCQGNPGDAFLLVQGMWMNRW